MALYKYLNSQRIDVLSNLKIRFTQPLEWNDPFEMRPYYYDNMKPRFFGELLHSDYIDVNNINKLINSNFVSLALTENPYNLMMWSHYAKDHSGFVIEFDENDSFFSDHGKLLFKIPYSNIRPVVEKKYVKQLCEELIENLSIGRIINLNDFQKFSVIFNKSIDWYIEKEWRLITLAKFSKIVSGNNKMTYYSYHSDTPARNRLQSNYRSLFDLPPSSIKSIIFGYNMIIKTRNEIKNICKANVELEHVKLFESITDSMEYKLEFREITNSTTITN
jgi:hypothetical protein